MNTNLFSSFINHSTTFGNQLVNMTMVGALRAPRLSTENTGSLYEMAQNALADFPSTTNFMLYIHSMTVDYTFVNTGETTVELDIYNVVCRKQLSYVSTDTRSLIGYFESELSEEGKLAGAATKYSMNVLGVTPFQLQGLTHNFVITKKQRFYISPGQAISFVERHVFRKPFKVSGLMFNEGSDLEANQYIPGISRGLCIIQKGVPDDTLPVNQSAVSVSAQANYRFKIYSADNKARNAVGF